jgi:plasmid stabilization system protein ParE
LQLTLPSKAAAAPPRSDSPTNSAANAAISPPRRYAWGRARNELRAGLRSHPYKSYVIFFDYIEDVLEIINVIEGHSDIPALFREDGGI